MDVQLFNDADVFLQEAERYLAADPSSASVIAAYAGRVRAGRQPRGRGTPRVAVTAGGRVVGLAVHTPFPRLFGARMPGPAAVAVAEAPAEHRRTLPGVNGESSAEASFAAAWQERPGEAAVEDVRMRMYCLGDLKPPAWVPGEHGLASACDTGWPPSGW